MISAKQHTAIYTVLMLRMHWMKMAYIMCIKCVNVERKDSWQGGWRQGACLYGEGHKSMRQQYIRSSNGCFDGSR